MQLHFLALLLSATSLALPTENDGEKAAVELTKRGNWPWLAAYALSDWGCTGAQLNGVRPEFQTSCVPFSASGSYVGINWGSWPLEATSGITVYSDKNCKNSLGNVNAVNRNNTNSKGSNTCVQTAWYGGNWGSIAQQDTQANYKA